MVPEHKLRQQIYHQSSIVTDLNIPIPYIKMDDTTLAFHVVDYFYNPSHELCYPAKSYAVAIIYAHLIDRYWRLPMKMGLMDPGLLFFNDKHFVPYHLATDIYDTIFQFLDIEEGIKYNFPQVRATVEYFNAEFFINENPYFNNANLHK